MKNNRDKLCLVKILESYVETAILYIKGCTNESTLSHSNAIATFITHTSTTRQSFKRGVK